MGAPQHDAFALAGRVVLAHEQPFALGSLWVDPARRQIRGDGRSETVEPRVMQVLVALARAGGEVITRDELTEYCWNGRIVGDDSINRVLSRIRRIAAGIGGGSFSIETIPRVGYRLAGDGLVPPSSPDEQREDPPIPMPGRRRLLAGIAATAIAAAIGTGVAIGVTGRREAIPTEARQLYERADAMRSTATPAATSLALPYLQEAVRIAPEFGEAWSALALEYRREILHAPERRIEFEQRLHEAVAKARLYAPGHPDAEAAMLLRDDHYGRWSASERVYRGLAGRHPRYAIGHHLLGTLLMDVGRWNDALRPLRTSTSLQPLAPIPAYKLIVALWGAGQISEADDAMAAAMRRWPLHGAIWQTRVKLLALTGRPRAALALLDDAAARPPDEDHAFDRQMGLIATALLTGRPADRSAALQALESSEDHLPRAIFSAALGAVPLALDMLESIYLQRGPRAKTGTPPIVTHPLFQPHAAPLWRERRFEALLADIGLEAYWRSARISPDYRRQVRAFAG